MYKVLVFGMTENPGGVESFVMSYYRSMDHEKIHFDFLVNTKNKVAYEDELNNIGSRFYHIISRSKNPIIYRIELNNFFKKHSKDYQCIWVNVNSLANIDYLKLAKKYKIKRRIIHSHNSQNMDGRIRGYLHMFNKNKIAKYATDYWACSSDAAKWFYKDTLMPKVKIIKNAIDINRAKFDLEKRLKNRKKYNLNNYYVLGNVGRLHFQKNQVFALRIMKELVDIKSNVKMIFVGQGEDREKLEQLSESLGIRNYVIFAGIQKDMSKWLSTFDIFLFPSLFEGLPIAGLEAQANGVPILASENILPNDSIINDNLEFLKLTDSPKIWAQKILLISQVLQRVSNKQVISNFDNSGYNINNEAYNLENMLIKDDSR